MRLIDILGDRRAYIHYSGKRSDGVILIIALTAICLSFMKVIRLVLANYYIILPIWADTAAGIMVIYLFWYLQIRTICRVHDYYANIGDELVLTATDKSLIIEEYNNIQEIPWEEFIRIEKNKTVYRVIINGLPILLINSNKLSEQQNKHLNKIISVYQDIWNSKKEMPIADNQALNIKDSNQSENDKMEDTRDGYYVEMTKERYLRKNKIRRILHINTITYILMIIFLVPIAIYLLLGPGGRLVALVFLLACLLIKRSIVREYERVKNKLSYSIRIDRQEGLNINDCNGKMQISWQQIKRIDETKKDFFFYLSDYQMIMLPKDLMKNEDILDIRVRR